MNYNLTRKETSKILNVSTRSVDRYIRSGKLRSEKIGKTIFINKIDVENIKSGNSKKQEFIVTQKKIFYEQNKIKAILTQ